MAILIKRNNAGNCIEFQGSSNPVYWNSCLSGQVDSSDNTLVNVINNIKTAQTGIDQYEFFRIPFTEFRDENGVTFNDAQEVADYITLKGNVASPEDINVGYKGTFDASLGSDPSYSTPENGDWFFITVDGNINGVEYKVNDIIKYSDVTSSWERIENKNATVQELEDSALDQYDIHVDGGYTGTIRNGSSLYPYNDLAVAIASSIEGNSILIKGSIQVPNSPDDAFVLPHSLYFYGADKCEVKYTTFSDTNGNLFYFEGTDNTQIFSFKNVAIKNAGKYAIHTKKTAKVEVRDCILKHNAWNGLTINTVASSSVTGLLSYDSTPSELQAFYAGVTASNGGACRIEESTQVLIIGNTVTENLRGIRVQDCGINGGGFITRNQSSQNIESGIYIAAGALGGCHNITTTVNVSQYNANNGILCIGGINNKFSQNEINGNWNAGFCAWGAANTTLRDCGLYDNNRSQYNGIGNVGDAKASIQINEVYNLLGQQISLNPNFRFIAEILDTQVHYTGVGSNTEKIGFLITSDVGNLPDNPKNIIKIDDVGFIGQDYAIDFSEVDLTNLRVSLGDNSYQSIGQKAVKAPLAGNYSELPFSNHVMEVPEVDIVVDTLKQTIALHEGVGGSVINVYSINELKSILKTNSVDIIQKSSDKIQLRNCTLGNVYINGVVAGSNINTMNDSLNAAFSMDLIEYKYFIETEVGVEGSSGSATFYYIESPDGTYHYPLFKTEAEANQVDTDLGGTGSSHTHTYVDDLTNTTWYMPNVSNHMNSSSAPLNGLYTAPNGGTIANVIWNIQTTDDDVNYLPTFSNITYNVQEGSAINIQYKAAGMTDTFNLTNVPAGYADNGFAIIGTAEDITNGYGQSVTHVINVTQANSFGSVQGTITINIKADLAGNEFTLVDQGGSIKFTQDGGATVLDFNTVTFNAGSTYKFYLDGATLQTSDVVDIADANGNGITGNDGLTQFGAGPGYAGAYLQYAIPSDVAPGVKLQFWNAGTFYTFAPLTIAGSTYTETITGITKEGPSANQTGTNIMDQYDNGWISLNESLSAGERLVLDNAFFTDLLEYLTTGSHSTTQIAIGLKGANWANTKLISNSPALNSGETFKGDSYISIEIGSSNNVWLRAYANGSQTNQMLVNTDALHQTLCAFIEVTNSGNNIRAAFGRNNLNGITQGMESTELYSDWNSYKIQTGDQNYGISSLDVMIAFWTYSGDAIDGEEIDWTGITEVSVPTAPVMETDWTKAVDFSGGNEHVKQVSSNTVANALRMHAYGSLATNNSDVNKTSDHNFSRPWATAIVFNIDGNNSNQHIWNSGEGTGSNDDNIYVRLSASKNLYFGWGREGGVNECQITSGGILSTNQWYGLYIAHKGGRFNATDATPANLGDAFDIRLMSSVDSFNAVGSNLSSNTTWLNTGNRMDRTYTGDFTIGGRSSNRNFHGKVASMVITPLRRGVAIPTDAEIKLMITDPKKWEDDYRIGKTVRSMNSTGTYEGTYNPTNHWLGYYGTQIWLMGDGSQDSYANGVRNELIPADQNYSKLQFNSMQSNDIQNVSITGLS